MNRHELGSFLRSRREALRPDEAGLPPGAGARRTPGLRREEVAWSAGVSVSYYERLEQARGARPSVAVLTAVAGVLRLSGAELDHALVLAGHGPPVRGPAARKVPHDVLALLARFAGIPAYVVNARLDVLAWNPMATAALLDFPALPAAERNLVRISTRGGDDAASTPALATGWAAMMAARLREAHAAAPTDPALRALIDHAAAYVPGFAGHWDSRTVDAPRTMGKHLRHRTLGDLDLDTYTLTLPGTDLALMLFDAAPGSPSRTALDTLVAPAAG